MATTHFQVSGNPDTDPKAAAQWLGEQRRRPVRAPHKTVQYGELVITKGGLSSLPNEELWSILEQVAIAAIELARFDLAELCISRLTSRFPGSQRVTCLQGMLLEGQGEPTKAIELYENAMAKEQSSLILSRRRIAAIKSTGDTKQTVEALNSHLDIFYNDPEAWQELAEVYATHGMYAQSAFALEELLLQIPQNGFFHLKYAETLYTNGDLTKAYKAYLRVLELCKSDGGVVDAKENASQGPWLRALWGTKMVTTALIATPPARTATASEEPLDQVKVQKIDQLVTNLLLNKVYTPQAVPSKHLRDVARAVLAA